MNLTDEQRERLGAIVEALRELARLTEEDGKPMAVTAEFNNFKPYPEVVDQNPGLLREKTHGEIQKHWMKHGEYPTDRDRLTSTWRVEDSLSYQNRRGSSPGEVNLKEKLMNVPLAWGDDGIDISTHEMGHVAWSPIERPETKYPGLLLEVMEDARVNIGLERKAMPMRLTDQARGLTMKMMEGDARRGDPVSTILRAIAGLGTDGEPYSKMAMEKLPEPWHEFGIAWMRRVRESLERAAGENPVGAFDACLKLAERFDRDLRELIDQETRKGTPGMEPGKAPDAVDDDGNVVMKSELRTPPGPKPEDDAKCPKDRELNKGEFKDVPIFQGKEEIKHRGEDPPSVHELKKRFEDLKSTVEEYESLARTYTSRDHRERMRSRADTYRRELQNLKRDILRAQMQGAIERKKGIGPFTPRRTELGKSMVRSWIVEDGNCAPLDMAGMFGVGVGGDFDSDSDWLLSGAMEGFDEAEKKFGTDTVSFRHMIEMKERMARPGEMTITTPRLSKKMDRIAVGNAKRPAASDEGTMIRRPDRLLIDRAIFARKRPRRGVSVLVDTSGSMSLEPHEVEQIVLAAGGDALVAIYSGEYDHGELRIVAQDAMRVPNEQFKPYGGNNVVDYPALEWLSKQPAPRLWVSDGGVTGVGDSGDSYLQGLCFDLATRNGIVRVEDADEAVKYLNDMR